MPVPTYDKFIEPVLRCLAAHPDGAITPDVYEAAAVALALTDSDKQELLHTGQPVYKNRTLWAHDRLKRAGFSVGIRRGLWQLTSDGRLFVERHRGALSTDEVEQLA